MDDIDLLIDQLATGKLSPEDFQKRVDEMARARAEKLQPVQSQVPPIEPSPDRTNQMIIKSLTRKLKAL